MNKDNIIPEEKNNGITPEAISEALDSLPQNYIVQTLIVLKKWEDSGIIKKSYTKRYISKVKLGEDDAFNEDIMNALVEVGTKNKEIQEKFGRITKKASTSN
ncbi:hypothetical protein ACM55G_14600 [Flavobacterium sp. LB3P122]|uniref:hypothetical protein n=1 Tax=Flavobacterium algoriphilum TaxID=3398738 RepID=UPI003A8C3EEE